MSSLIHFITEIGKVDYEIPYYVKSGAIVVLIILVTSCVFIFNDMFKKGVFRESYIWYYLVILFNLVNIFLIVTYYNYKKNQRGDIGSVGKVGNKGKRGKFLNCGYCKYTLFFLKNKRYETICSIKKGLSSNTKELVSNKYINLIESNTVNYNDFLIDVLIGEGIIEDKIKSKHLEYSRLISSIMFNKELILEVFCHYLNVEINNLRSNILGQIIRPINKSGYLILGDTSQNSNMDLKLNSFLVASSGTSETLYPIKFNKLVTFNSYNQKLNKYEPFTIWRGIGQSINGIDEKGNNVVHKYHSLGDICSYGTEEPDRDFLATIHQNCLEPVDDNDLKMMFIHFDVSSLDINVNYNSDSTPSYDELTREYKIMQPSVSIEMFSIWRTPLNTFITNYINNEHNFINNTIAYNIVGDRPEKIDEFGNVKLKYKKDITRRLKLIKLNKLQKIFILVNHYSYKYLNELKYYLYRADSSNRESTSTKQNNKSGKDRILDKKQKNSNIYVDYTIEGASQIADNSVNIKQLMDFIEEKQDEYEIYNMERARTMYNQPGKPSNPMKKIPKYLLNVYNKVKNGLYQIETKLETINNLYDLLEDIFPNNINQRIAVNQEGIAEGGEYLNFAQEILLYICKIVNPPSKKCYMVKEECLGHTKIDKDKRNLMMKVETAINEYKMLMNDYKKNPNRYCNSWESIIKYQDLTFNKLGQHLGHIDNYLDKIESLELDEFTKSRLEVILEQYTKLNNYIKINCSLE